MITIGKERGGGNKSDNYIISVVGKAHKLPTFGQQYLLIRHKPYLV